MASEARAKAVVRSTASAAPARAGGTTMPSAAPSIIPIRATRSTAGRSGTHLRHPRCTGIEGRLYKAPGPLAWCDGGRSVIRSGCDMPAAQPRPLEQSLSPRFALLAYLSCIRYPEVFVLQGSPLLGAAFALQEINAAKLAAG